MPLKPIKNTFQTLSSIPSWGNEQDECYNDKIRPWTEKDGVQQIEGVPT